MNKKHTEPCALFLEDAFAESHAQSLRDAGYPRVERFATHFRDETAAHTEQSVKDPRIIRLCNKECWLLITTDSSMKLTHLELIKKTQITILATAHNNAEDMGEWIEGLIKAKPSIERHFKKTPRPWCGTFSRQGDVHIKPISMTATTRRKRPREMEAPEVMPEKPAEPPLRDVAG